MGPICGTDAMATTGNGKRDLKSVVGDDDGEEVG